MRLCRYLRHAVVALLACRLAAAEDWPTFRHDNRRSGTTGEALPAQKLGLAWAWQAPHPPQPAWHGPAKWDAYHNLRGLKSMRNYDPVFHVIAVGDAVYFGSSADDAVRCLDARTGKERWVFVADGPVRTAPTFADGKLYFGSDDGYAYCLRASDGTLVWKHSPQPNGRLVLNNGRLISFWPVRTGVLVQDGTAYFAASLLPWKESYLCAVDAATGEPRGPGRFAAKFSGVTFEGPLLAAAKLLVAPQGRVAPLLFDRASGRKFGGLKGGGGCFALLTTDGQLLHGPGNKAGWITDSKVALGAKPATLATYPKGNAMVVAASVAYVLTDHHLSAFDRKQKKRLWQVACDCPYELILAGDTLLAGGADRVAAFRVRDGKRLASYPVRGRAYGLAVANGALLVSTDDGQTACFRPGGRPVQLRAQPSPPPKHAAAIPRDTAPALLGRWVFHHSQLDPARKHVQDLAGKSAATLLGKARIVPAGELEALQLDGKTSSALIAADHTKARLPTRAMTAEAWVQVDAPLDWGGIVGAAQDNGRYERGWILGYIKGNFSFALAAKGGKDTLGYIKSKTPFTPRRWYHVVGTYDGASKKLYVDGKLEAAAADQRGDINYPPQAFYEIGAYHDKDEYFRMTGRVHEVRVYRRALTAAEIARRYEAKREALAGPLVLAVKPRLRFVARDAAVVRWETDRASPSILELGINGTKRQIADAKPKTLHQLRISGLRKNRIYTCRIEAALDGRRALSAPFECDTFLNFSVPPVPADPRPYPGSSKPCVLAAEHILARTPVRRGIALVLGCRQGRLAYELARRSELRVIGVDTDPAAVAAARRALMGAGVYGARISVRHVPSLAELPFPGQFADLILSERLLTDGDFAGTAAEVLRLLRPGGIALLGQPRGAARKLTKAKLEAWLKAGGVKADVRDGESGLWATLTRPAPPGAGEWSHQYGRPDNSAFGGESLAGVTTTADMEVQWIGRPGPRAQADRNGRKPSPLAINGRLFLQGLRRIIAINAYNGTILWSLEIPNFLRFNVPRDCSNWCADPDHLFAAVGDEVWQIDAATGKVARTHSVLPGPHKDWQYDWGYVASVGDALLGSAVKQGSAFTNFWGGEGWYDAAAGPLAAKVCSDNLFALAKNSGSLLWSYADGLIINPTITVGGGRAYFVESRNADLKASDSRRVTMHELWQSQFLVALDLKTGRKLWERLVDTTDGHTAFYLAYGGEKLALVSSGGKKYQVCVYAAADGSEAWEASFGWPKGKGDHGSHMSLPAILGGRLYVRPSVFDLAGGKRLEPSMPRGGCGTYAATKNAFFFRAGSVTVWNPKTGKASAWSRLRPDCWVSTIPASGMLLSPEGGGGCSCGSWMETSLGFAPVRRP